MSDHEHTLEIKAETGPMNPAVHHLAEAFESYKETNDERMGEFERRGAADPLLEERLSRIERSMEARARSDEERQRKAARPHLSGLDAGEGHTATLAMKRAFEGYVRKGAAGPAHSLEAKALSMATSTDGGMLVPPETESIINKSVKAISPIRAIATVQQISGSVLKKPFQITSAATGWVGETATRPETTSPTLAELSFQAMELYAMPAASSALLDDSAVDIDQWIADEVRLTFAKQEGTAFITGNGVNKPRGFLDYTKVANASWTWGNVGYLATGTAGAFPASNAGDKLLDLVYALKADYRANGTFVMNRNTLSAVRKLKDTSGAYLWQPALQAGQPSTLLGYPVTEAEDMPDIGTDTYPIAFGDFRRGYLIVDRVGIRILRDPYSAKPYVLFYTTKRVGGGVQDFEAMKLLKFGTA